MDMPLAPPEDEVEHLDWGGGEVHVIAGDDEGEWLSVENDDFFIDPEDAV